MIRKSLVIDFDIDFKFWHLFPSININLHSKELEFEWMCVGIYISRKKDNRAKELAERELWRKLPEYKSLFSGSWNYKDKSNEPRLSSKN